MKKCVIPISGGLDSTVILNHVHKNYDFDEIHALSFDYGQRHKKEINCAVDQVFGKVKSFKTVKIDFISQLFSTSSITNPEIDVAETKDVLGDPQTVNYVPNRNTIFLSICTGYAESLGADTVFHGSALVDSEAGYWDGSKEFLTSINKHNSLNRRDKIKIEAPLIELSKKEIVKLGIDCGVDFTKTWTCYKGQDKACGTCPACSSRLQGFILNKKIDPLEYSINIDWNKFDCEPII
jgi:7-cyano-7-deazaguanine synthase